MSTAETITWHRADEGRPDADLVVLVAFDPDTVQGEPVWLGTWNGDEWVSVDSGVFEEGVTHWADVPHGPGGPHP